MRGAPAPTRLPLGEVLRRHGVRPDRRLGQHFLLDPRILARVAAAAELAPGDPTLEVGPGIGGLTRELAATGARVLAVELDRRLEPALAEVLTAAGWAPRPWPPREGAFGPGVYLAWGDAVRLDWPSLERAHPGPWTLCANLPFQITGPFLAAFLGSGLPWRRAVLMVQREAADRMLAAPGHPAYGAFSCLVRYHAEGVVVFSVARGAFVPPPSVDASVVRLEPRPAPPGAPREAVLRVVRAAFSQRRKLLRNALAGALGLRPPEVAAVLAALGLPASSRAEDLGLEAFVALARELLHRGLIG
jgi:16S rRNA (adenine1518-N6/adenine1519-N6)-dimethyltransferase